MAKSSYIAGVCGLALALIGILAGGASAADTAYGPGNPTPEDKLRPLCTDRPTKSTSPCTVDPGHIQIESDLYDEIIDTAQGARTTTQLFTSPTVKLGLTDTIDVEASLTPWERIATKSGGSVTSISGTGDLYLRAKFGLPATEGGSVAVAVIPYVKVPTARRGIGDGAVEGGVIVPVSINLPAGWSLVVDPEGDVLEDASGRGQHPNASLLFSLSRNVTETVTLSGELWSDVEWRPEGQLTQASADLGAAWIPKSQPNLQLDGGVNIGLNHETPSTQLYVGLSRRF